MHFLVAQGVTLCLLLFYALNTFTLESNTMLFWILNKALIKHGMHFISVLTLKMRQRVSGMFFIVSRP